MSYKQRLVQFLVLGLIILSILYYTSYNNTSHLQSLQLKLNYTVIFGKANITWKSTSNVELSSNLTQYAPPAITSSSILSSKKIGQQFAAHIIPKYEKLSILQNSSKIIDKSLTKYFYESGHVIPNSGLCPEIGKNMKLLILITSSPDHTDARMAIRYTWGAFSKRRDINLAFVVGISKIARLNKMIKAESEMFGDLIQSAFMDAYENLTLKTISMFEWVDNYCSAVPFVLKTDDDMFINIPKLLSLCEKRSKTKRTIFGRLAKRWKPIRKNNSKYFVSVNQFAPTIFPDFTTGPAYLLTGDVVRDLYKNSLNLTYLKLEDVFMTGVVAQKVRVKRVHVNEFLNKKIPFNVCNIRKNISIHMIKFYEQFDLWQKLHDVKTRCK